MDSSEFAHLTPLYLVDHSENHFKTLQQMYLFNIAVHIYVNR